MPTSAHLLQTYCLTFRSATLRICRIGLAQPFARLEMKHKPNRMPIRPHLFDIRGREVAAAETQKLNAGMLLAKRQAFFGMAEQRCAGALVRWRAVVSGQVLSYYCKYFRQQIENPSPACMLSAVFDLFRMTFSGIVHVGIMIDANSRCGIFIKDPHRQGASKACMHANTSHTHIGIIARANISTT